MVETMGNGDARDAREVPVMFLACKNKAA